MKLKLIFALLTLLLYNCSNGQFVNIVDFA